VGETIEYFTNSNLSLIPAVILQAKIGQTIPFMKFGFSMNFVNMNLFEGTYTYEYTTDYSIGVNASIGLNYLLNNNIGIFIETSVSSFTFYADKVIFTEEINGVKHSQEFELRDKFGNGYGNLEAIHEFPFNSINISVGVKYIL